MAGKHRKHATATCFILLSFVIILTAGCQLALQFLGIQPAAPQATTVTVSGVVTLSTTVGDAPSGQVRVGAAVDLPISPGLATSSFRSIESLTLAPGQSSSFVLNGLAPGKYVIVAFLDSNGNGVYDAGEAIGSFPAGADSLQDFQSNFTGSNITIALPPSDAPPIPTGLGVSGASSSALAVSWDAAAGATSYRLFRETTATGPFVDKVYEGAAASVTDGGLNPSTPYFYEVQATNVAGASGMSAPVSATTAPAGTPATPGGLNVGDATSASLFISWATVADATSYQLFRDQSATGSFATQVYIGATTSFTDTGLSPGTTYYYKVQASNTSGPSGLSVAVSATTTGTPPPPPTPSGLSVGDPSSTSLFVQWNSDSTATAYLVLRDTTSAFAAAVTAYSGGSTSFTDSNAGAGLTSGTTYYYKVQASNANGPSAFSAFTWATTAPAPAPSVAPSGLAVTALSTTSISLGWNPVSSASQYQLYRSTDPFFASPAFVYGGAGTSFNDSGLVSGTSYYYEVRASNSGGPSPLSAIVSGTTSLGGGLPDTPFGLSVSGATDSSLAISWDAVAGATSYGLIRSTDPSFSTFVPVGTFAAPQTSVTDTNAGTGLAPGTTYYYEVEAINGAGSSAFSGVAFGTTTSTAGGGIDVHVQ